MQKGAGRGSAFFSMSQLPGQPSGPVPRRRYVGGTCCQARRLIVFFFFRCGSCPPSRLILRCTGACWNSAFFFGRCTFRGSRAVGAAGTSSSPHFSRAEFFEKSNKAKQNFPARDSNTENKMRLTKSSMRITQAEDCVFASENFKYINRHWSLVWAFVFPATEQSFSTNQTKPNRIFSPVIQTRRTK